MTNITVYAAKHKAGTTQQIAGAEVQFTCGVSTCAIEYCRYTKDYSADATRCWVVTATQRRYKTLEAAVRAILKTK